MTPQQRRRDGVQRRATIAACNWGDFATAAALASTLRKPLLSSSGANAVLDDGRDGASAAGVKRQVAKLVFGGAATGLAICIVGWLLLRFLGGWTVAWKLIITLEVVFCAWWVTIHAPRLNAQPSPHAPDKPDAVLAFRRLVAHARFYQQQCGLPINWRLYLTRWFNGAAVRDIKLGNLREMLAYGFLYSTREQAEREGKWPLVEEMARQLAALGATQPAGSLPSTPSARSTAATDQSETQRDVHNAKNQPGNGPACGDEPATVSLEEGYTPGLTFMAHLWQPLRYHYRPATFYIITEALHWVAWGALTALGLRYVRVEGTTVYYTPGALRNPAARSAGPYTGDKGAPSHRPNTPPLLFLHGIGLGLTPYLLVLCRLLAAGHDLVAPEFRHVSLRLSRHVPTASDVAHTVARALRVLGCEHKAFCVVGHSYGTFVSSCFARAYPGHVHSLALVDPVCFGMYLPSLLYTFVYKTPLEAFRKGGWSGLARCLSVWLLSRDLHLSATFCRRFYWTEVTMWPEDLPARTLVVLAGADELLHANEVRAVVSGSYRGVPRGPKPLGLSDLLAPLPEDYAGGSRSGCARVLWHPSCGHADWLLRSSWQVEVVRQLDSLARGEAPQEHVVRRMTATVLPGSALGLIPSALHDTPPMLASSMPPGAPHGNVTGTGPYPMGVQLGRAPLSGQAAIGAHTRRAYTLHAGLIEACAKQGVADAGWKLPDLGTALEPAGDNMAPDDLAASLKQLLRPTAQGAAGAGLCGPMPA